jgi:hypothetical protein
MTEQLSIAQGIRQGLIDLKNDRSTYIRSPHVLAKYEELCDVLRAHVQHYGADAKPDSEKSPEQLEGEWPSFIDHDHCLATDRRHDDGSEGY